MTEIVPLYKCSGDVGKEGAIPLEANQKKEDRKLIFPSRYVTRVQGINPLRTSKHFMDTSLMQDPKSIVEIFFNERNLQNVLLLVTPTALLPVKANKFLLHGYAANTERHLGVTNISRKEKSGMERELSGKCYSMVTSSAYIELKDAYNSKLIKRFIFEQFRLKSTEPKTFKCFGNKIIMQYKVQAETVQLQNKPSVADTQLVKAENTETILRLMEPVWVPATFTERANIQIQQKLCKVNDTELYHNFGGLIQSINERPIPENSDLMNFFTLADLLQFKMYVRPETYWLRNASTQEPRFRIECFMFDDRMDFIVSLALLCTQLEQFAEMYPGIKPNLRYIDNPFELLMPDLVTNCMKSVANMPHARPVVNFLAELTYDIVQPPATILALTQGKGSKEAKKDQKELMQALEIPEALSDNH